jgi:hypothetical protein
MTLPQIRPLWHIDYFEVKVLNRAGAKRDYADLPSVS